MSDIPLARKILEGARAQADEDGYAYLVGKIDAALALMVRRKPNAPVAPDRSKPVTPEVSEQMRTLKRQHPELSQMAIAMMVGCASGRVSEALHHDR